MKKLIKHLALRHKAKKFSKVTGCLGVVCLGDGQIISETEYWRIANTEKRENLVTKKPIKILERVNHPLSDSHGKSPWPDEA